MNFTNTLSEGIDFTNQLLEKFRCYNYLCLLCHAQAVQILAHHYCPTIHKPCLQLLTLSFEFETFACIPDSLFAYWVGRENSLDRVSGAFCLIGSLSPNVP